MLQFKKFLIPSLVAASLLVAACGSSSNKSAASSTSAKSASTSSSYPTTSTAAATSHSSSSSSLTIGTAKGKLGTYLTGASGRALYLWVADSTDKSNCSGSCADVWRPLTASSTPKVTGGAIAADISLITRANGTKQVAYKGHPLYYYAGDTGPGSTSGEGSDGFGAKWWLVSPSGAQITGSSSSSSSASSGGSSSGKSSSWG